MTPYKEPLFVNAKDEDSFATIGITKNPTVMYVQAGAKDVHAKKSSGKGDCFSTCFGGYN